MGVPTYVCDRCGGSNVFYDAYVGVNDPTDVRTFDATFCDDCEGECGLQPQALANGVEIEAEVW